jgi:hypothetical protein
MRNILLCALALAVPFSAFAAGTSSRSITLKVTSSGCQYTGGDNSAGDVTFHVGTKASVALHVSGGYTIDDIRFASDPNNQLSVPTPSGSTAVIQDKNTVAQEATYKVTVKGPDGASIPCDPKIINN